MCVCILLFILSSRQGDAFDYAWGDMMQDWIKRYWDDFSLLFLDLKGFFYGFLKDFEVINGDIQLGASE